MNDANPPRYYCTFRDGTVQRGLTYVDSLELFNQAFKTENPCRINLQGDHFDTLQCIPSLRSQS